MKARYAGTSPSSIGTCTIVEAELRYGAVKSSNPTSLARLIDEVLAEITVLTFDPASAKEYATIRASLETAGNMIGGNDLLIAAIALAHDLIVVTHNTSEFERVPGLTVEDWEQE